MCTESDAVRSVTTPAAELHPQRARMFAPSSGAAAALDTAPSASAPRKRLLKENMAKECGCKESVGALGAGDEARR